MLQEAREILVRTVQPTPPRRGAQVAQGAQGAREAQGEQEAQEAQVEELSLLLLRQLLGQEKLCLSAVTVLLVLLEALEALVLLVLLVGQGNTKPRGRTAQTEQPPLTAQTIIMWLQRPLTLHIQEIITTTTIRRFIPTDMDTRLPPIKNSRGTISKAVIGTTAVIIITRITTVRMVGSITGMDTTGTHGLPITTV